MLKTGKSCTPKFNSIETNPINKRIHVHSKPHSLLYSLCKHVVKSLTEDALDVTFTQILYTHLLWGSGKSSAMQVECYAADGGLVGSNIHGRFAYVGQVYQAHMARLSTWVGQQGVVRVGAQTAQTCGE